MYGNVCGELIIPKIWCYFNVKAPIYEVVLLEKSSVFHSYAGGKVELFNVSDYSTEEWKIDLEELKRKIPEISWNASPYAVDINSFSLDDFYFATI